MLKCVMEPLWGAWVITAAIIWPNGTMSVYNPSTLFDQTGCMIMAAWKNREFHDAGLVGFVTCKRVNDEQIASKGD